MRSKYFILALVILVLFCDCTNAQQGSSSKSYTTDETLHFYDSLANICLNLEADFKRDSDIYLLDSILSIIERNKCDTFSYAFIMKKVGAYTKKKDYYNGLVCLEEANHHLGRIDNSLRRDAPNYFCDILHLKAIIAQHEGNLERKEQYIHEILDTLSAIVPAIEEDSVCKLNSLDQLFKYPQWYYLLRLYYYRIQVRGFDIVYQEFLEKYPDFDNPDIIFGYIPDFMVFEMY